MKLLCKSVYTKPNLCLSAAKLDSQSFTYWKQKKAFSLNETTPP